MKLHIGFSLAAALMTPATAQVADQGIQRINDRLCSENAVPILLLGTYHMANPGLDSVNLEADDVLSARRQAEIEELVGKLAAFRPTKIMVEAPYLSRDDPDAYRKYLAGEHELGRNEIEQIGFRLARRMNMPTIVPIDFQMRMSGLRPDELDPDWRPPSPPAEQASSQAQTQPREPSEEERILRNSTVREYLLRLNDPERVAANHSANYLGNLMPDPSTPALYRRTDLLLNWYQRNLRMMANIVREAEERDRVLVLVGSGHLKLLGDLARDADFLCLADTTEYLR